MVSEKVATETSERLRDYELIVIIKPEIAEDRLEATLNSISQFIAARDGTITEAHRWGKRKLAYPIKHFLEGYYVLSQVKIRPATGRELGTNLRISEDVLRHLLIRVDS